MNAFKVPQIIAQDLLLIHDIIGITPTTPVASAKQSRNALQIVNDYCIDSSDSENGSEDEIEADLTALNDDDVLTKSSPTSDSSSELDSDSESEASDPEGKPSETVDLDGDEDSGPSLTSGTYFQTKNEVVETDVVVPEITEVGPDEVLEKVGDIMSVIGNTIIINGVPSDIANRGSDRALDSDTLLVFPDRKVLGYVYETFGPTSQPFYQVRFNKDFPLDPEKAHVSAEIFHVPARSHFVFLSHLKKLKGSDASNVHDEEPGENELEFSDDEAEAAYKANIKRKRGDSRAQSVTASSRQGTPAPSQMHDEDMERASNFSRNPYDEHGPYDVGFNASLSRPPPIPYDDPYSDTYEPSAVPPPAPRPRGTSDRHLKQHPRNLGLRGRAIGRDRGHSGGRGRGRGRGRGEHTLHGHPGPDFQPRESNAGVSPWSGRSTQVQQERSLSPTSFAIARATGQLPDDSYANQMANQSSQPPTALGGWGYPDAFQSNAMFQYGGSAYLPGFVQPHINPRFANAFGMNMNMATPSPHYTPHNNVLSKPSEWTDEWAMPVLSGAQCTVASDITDVPK